MVRTIRLNTQITAERELHIALPSDIPTGPAEVVLVVACADESSARTLGGLANSRFFGMWSGRTDFADSVEFAERLRAESWKRSA